MKKSNPKISIIMPNYNGAKYLRQSIQHFLQQNYLHKELIIVDKKSTDESHQIIDNFVKNSSNIMWVKDEDRGISDAFNIGLKYCQGDIIGYLGSDDLLYKNIFEEIAFHSQWCDFDAIYFNSYNYYPDDKKCYLRKCPSIQFDRNSLLKYGTIVQWQDIFFKRYIYDRYQYDPDNKYSMDYEFYLRIAHENFFYLYVDNIATINVQDGNISTVYAEKQIQEALAVAMKYAQGYQGKIYFSNQTTLKRKIKNRLKLVIEKILEI